jgi:hypothetical protein
MCVCERERERGREVEGDLKLKKWWKPLLMVGLIMEGNLT